MPAAKYPQLYLIGLTGNIACGKSSVLAMLRERGAHTLDADQVVHQLQQPGTPVYQAIVETFGPAVAMEPGGPLDRARLGARVFGDPQALRQLEQIVHPAVHEAIHAWLQGLPASPDGPRTVAVVDAIKLIEAGWPAVCDALWVVTCRPEQQLERLVQTRGMSVAEARARIEAQPPQAEKAARADVLIDNAGSLAQTEAQVQAAWERIDTVPG
jgi:dephospho-CoA kinase